MAAQYITFAEARHARLSSALESESLSYLRLAEAAGEKSLARDFSSLSGWRSPCIAEFQIEPAIVLNALGILEVGEQVLIGLDDEV